MIFGRKKADQTRDEHEADPELDARRQEALHEAQQPETITTAGPYDVEDLPDDGIERIDLGSLLVPVIPGAQMRLDADNEQIVALTVVEPSGANALQLTVFAAPKTRGIWDSVRKEIAESLTADHRPVSETDGPFGPELHATLVGGKNGKQKIPARFIGVDGPRWFLRGLINGPGAENDQAAADLLECFRGVAVVRGASPMAPRDLLPLNLPADVAQQIAAEQQAQGKASDLNPFHRGPEITEIR